jgi:cardiolipin synthase
MVSKKRMAALTIAGIATLLVPYTILVTPKRFIQCLGAPLAFFRRDYGNEAGVILPDYVSGNKATLLVNGNEALPAMLDAINGASQSIRWQVMLFQPDEAGHRLADALVAAARRGVQVQLSFDVNLTANGSLGFPYPEQKKQRFNRDLQTIMRELRNAGAVVLDSRAVIDYPANGLSREAYDIQTRVAQSGCVPANHYDHRKILIVDDRLAIVGGMNVGNEYVYEIAPDISQDMDAEAAERQAQGLPEAWQKWQDVSVKVEGPVVASLAREFDWRWEVLGGKPMPAAQAVPPVGDSQVKAIAQRPGHGEIGASYFDLIENAQREIYVANPYVSYDRVLEALMAARKRGVRVVFVFPDRHNDSAISKRLFESYVEGLVGSGVEVYFNNLRMAHSKVMLVDGRWTIIGSFNLNYRSFAHDLETAVAIEDRAFAQEMFERVIALYLTIGTRITSPQSTQWSILDWLLQPFS